MQFLNESQKAVSLSIESPKDTLDAAAITAAMNALIASDVFTSSGGALVARKGARRSRTALPYAVLWIR